MKLDLVQPFRIAAERFRDYADDLKDGLHRKVPSAALLIFLTSGRTPFNYPKKSTINL